MTKILQVIKKIVLAGLVLYGYNLIAVNFNLTIPINFITLTLVSVLGFPMLFVLVLLKVILF